MWSIYCVDSRRVRVKKKTKIIAIASTVVYTMITGVYVWLVGIWRDHVSPAIQLLHLMYGIGALVAPLIAEPFLSSEM